MSFNQIFQGRKRGKYSLLLFAVSLLFVFPQSPVVFGQFDCEQFPDSGKTPQLFFGIIRVGVPDDFFHCGTGNNPTPTTCKLSNRVYSLRESACINSEHGFTGDYFPFNIGEKKKGYHTDFFTLTNYPADLGPNQQDWYLIWDHIVDETSPDCIGYYAAQSDFTILGEFGNPQFAPCDEQDIFLSGSCVDPVVKKITDVCNPQINTVLGDVLNFGGLGPVPVPIVDAVSGVDISDPSFAIDLRWLPACAVTAHDGAPDPIMGFRLEVLPDTDGNGSPDGPVVCDPDSTLFRPLLDIAMTPKGDDGVPDWTGDDSTTAVTLGLGDLVAAGITNPCAIEALTFRLRILFRDDRDGRLAFGGKDLIIDPVFSYPSLRSSTVALPAIQCTDADGDGFVASPDFPLGSGIDCDDTNPAIYPGAPEVGGNNIDENCDGIAEDVDGDGLAESDGDCDDSDLTIFPGALEIIDGIDNDCDGFVDELTLEVLCEMSPSSLNLQSHGSAFSIKTTLRNVNTWNTVDPEPLRPVSLSRISSPNLGDLILPVANSDPGCNNFTQDGIWENIINRSVTGSGTVTLRFNLPGDGRCETQDGNRQDLIAMMLGIPDGETARVCYRSTYPGNPDPVECCAPVEITNHDNR